MNTYEVFYRDRRDTVEADSAYEAQQKYADAHNVKKPHEVLVVLAARNGEPVVHTPDF